MERIFCCKSISLAAFADRPTVKRKGKGGRGHFCKNFFSREMKGGEGGGNFLAERTAATIMLVHYVHCVAGQCERGVFFVVGMSFRTDSARFGS